MSEFDAHLAEANHTLQQMGAFLYTRRSSTPSSHHSSIPSGKAPEPSFPAELELKELKTLLDNETQRNTILESRIAHKDMVLAEMASLQSELYDDIEQLQNECKRHRPTCALQPEQSHIDSLKESLENSRLEKCELLKVISDLTEQLEQKCKETELETSSTCREEPLVSELKTLFQVDSTTEISQKVKRLHSQHTHRRTANRESRTLLANLSKAAVDLSPPGTYLAAPTPSQIWRWVNSILSNYMTLKKKLSHTLFQV